MGRLRMRWNEPTALAADRARPAASVPHRRFRAQLLGGCDPTRGREASRGEASVGRNEDYERNRPAGDPLLILDVLIDRQQHVKGHLHLVEQVAVSKFIPAHFSGRAHLVSRQKSLEPPVHAVVEQDPHGLGSPLQQAFQGGLQNINCLLAGNALEAFEEFAQRFPTFEIVPQVLNRHASPVKARSAADPLGVDPDKSVEWIIRADELVFIGVRLDVCGRHGVPFRGLSDGSLPTNIIVQVRLWKNRGPPPRNRDGARNVDHILTGSLLPEMSREFLAKLADAQTVSEARQRIGRQWGVYVCGCVTIVFRALGKSVSLLAAHLEVCAGHRPRS